MHASVRSIDANDLPTWPNWQPTSVEEERQWFTVTIGPQGSAGGDLFQVCIASEAWFRHFPSGKFIGLVSTRFDVDSIRSTIEQFVVSASGADWPQLASALSSKMRWEFASMTGMA